MLRLVCYRVEHSKTLLTTVCQQGSAKKTSKSKDKSEIQGSFDSALRAFAQDDDYQEYSGLAIRCAQDDDHLLIRSTPACKTALEVFEDVLDFVRGPE